MARNVSPEVAAAYPLEVLTAWPRERRRHLVFVRCGRRSVHRRLYPLPAVREWDLALSCYEPPDDADLAQAEYVTTGAVTKWDAFAQLRFGRPASGFAHYDSILLCDDDVVFASPADIDALFRIAREQRLSVAQAALTPQSHGFWAVTRHHPSWYLRHTNFVECMAPVMAQEAIELLEDDIREAASGCGFDLVMHRVLGPNRRMAVVDAVTMTHSEPTDAVNGRFYTFLRSIGIDTDEETRWFLAKHGLEGIEATTLGGVPLAQRFYPGVAPG